MHSKHASNRYSKHACKGFTCSLFHARLRVADFLLDHAGNSDTEIEEVQDRRSSIPSSRLIALGPAWRSSSRKACCLPGFKPASPSPFGNPTFGDIASFDDLCRCLSVMSDMRLLSTLDFRADLSLVELSHPGGCACKGSLPGSGWQVWLGR